MKRLLAVSILICALCGSAPAQEYRGDGGGNEIVITAQSTLGDYLGYAALHNPDLQAAFERWRAAVEAVPQARAFPDPRFTFSYYIQEVETRVGPQRRSAALTMTFPWLGKLASRGDAAAGRADAAEQRYEAAKLALFYRVKQAYYEYYYLARAEETAEENVRLLTDLQEVTLAAYASAKGSYANAIKAQVELAKLEDLLRSLQDRRGPAVARLNAELNRPPDAALSPPARIDDEDAVFTDEEIRAWFRENPELKAAGYDAESRKAEWSLAKKQPLPDFMLGLSVIDTGPARMPGVMDSGKDPVVASISFNIPLEIGRYRAEAREKQAQYLAALSTRTGIENRLSAELEAALFGYRDAERKKDLYATSLIPKARQQLDVTRQAFAGAQASFLELIDAQRTLLEFTLTQERARADCAVRLAELEMRVGRELPRAERGNSTE